MWERQENHGKKQNCGKKTEDCGRYRRIIGKSSALLEIDNYRKRRGIMGERKLWERVELWEREGL